MARPTGRFAKQKETCYAWVLALTKPKCWASNAFLAKKLCVTERQVSRYLRALEKEGRIIRQQYRYAASGSLKTKRHIYRRTHWTPALVVPTARFEGYTRKVRMIEETQAEKEARWRKEYGIPEPKPEPTLEQKRAGFIRAANTPKRAGVIYSTGIQAIIDGLPEKYR